MLEKFKFPIIGKLYQNTTILYWMLCVFFSYNQAFSQEVPNSILLGGLEVEIEASAKRQIEIEINKLNTEWTSSFQKKTALYIPFVSEIFKKEEIPDFMKYIILQKNNFENFNLTGNQIGIWELDDDAIEDWALTVNEKVDERLNFSKATIATAKIIWRNHLLFQNWLFSLWAYEKGSTYVEEQSLKYDLKSINENNRLILDDNSPTFFIEFLACKILYENQFENNSSYTDKFFPYERGANKKLSQIAKEFNVDEQSIASYNPWLKSNKIPADKVYQVLIPLSSFDIHWQELPDNDVPDVNPPKKQVAKKNQPSNLKPPIKVEKPVHPPNPDIHNEPSEEYFENVKIVESKNSNSSSQIEENVDEGENSDEIYPTEIKIHTVVSGQTLFGIARLYQIPLNDLRKWNGMDYRDDIYTGEKLIISAVSKPAKVIEYQVQAGETLYKIADMYNITIEEIQKWNHMGSSYDINVGDILIIIPNSKIYLSPNSDEKSFYEKHKKQTPLMRD